jgi:TraG P-loop domain
VNGVRVQLINGPTGTGKSVHANQVLSLEQKYGGFTFIFDIGGSYESVVELYGGKIDRVGKDGPRINPFALEPTEANSRLSLPRPTSLFFIPSSSYCSRAREPRSARRTMTTCSSL